MADAYSEAWRMAAEDLGIRVTAPFTLDGPDGPTTYAAFVHAFGSETGAVATAPDQDRSVAETQGLWCSSPGSTYTTYNRAEWVAMLNDWGWFGEADGPPDWYTGQQW